MTDPLGAAVADGHVRHNIGEVLDLLRPDFPGITIPKIRFLEDKGLVKPERTPAGYRKFSPQDVVTAGRHADSEIFLDDVTVSRRHATFTREGSSFTVSDAGSLNGTYDNRDRIDTVLLKDTDEVQIGKYRLVFFQGHESP